MSNFLIKLTLLTQRQWHAMAVVNLSFGKVSNSRGKCCGCGLQVWQIVAGDSSSLTKQQFYSTLRLVSLAQVCKHCMCQVMFSIIRFSYPFQGMIVRMH